MSEANKEDGEKVSKEEAQFREVLSAVERGDEKAKTKLAWYKLSGCGNAEVDEDYAFALLTERVKDKDPDAMWMLGLCYEYGMGCEKDYDESESLYRRSSERRSVIGQFLAENEEETGCGVMKKRYSLLFFE